MADGFEVVTAGLLDSLVGVKGGVPGSTCETFSIPVGNVVSFAGAVVLCQSKVDDEDLVFVRFVRTNQEVVRFDVTVNNLFFVNFFDSLDLKAL